MNIGKLLEQLGWTSPEKNSSFSVGSIFYEFGAWTTWKLICIPVEIGIMW